MKRVVALFVLLCTLTALHARAAEPAKLKALWTTGGCCHDYKKNAPLLTGKIGERASVEFKVVFGTDQFKDPDYAKPYDVVVYDLCYASEKDKTLIGNITKTHAAGKPAVIIHCSLHTFRDIDWDDWRELMGMTSKSHDKFRALTTKKTADHPITRFWPADWKTEGDELYRNIKVWPSATPLLTCFSEESKVDHMVAWVNQYQKARVFGTTLGHNAKTIEQDSYYKLLTNGLLWVCGKLTDDGQPAPGYGR